MATRVKNYRQTQNSNIQTPYSIANFVALSPNKCRSETPMAGFKTSSVIKENPVVNWQRTMVEQIKKVRSQYQIRIIQLQNEVKYLKQQVDYKKQVHQRSLQNQKAIMQGQFTGKMRDIKNSLREQYIGYINENKNIKQKNRQLEEQIRLLKLRYERSQKYCKQIQQIMSEQKKNKGKQVQKLTTHITNLTNQEKQYKQKIQSIEQELTQHNIGLQKQKIEKTTLLENNQKLLSKIEALQKNIHDLNQKLKLQIVQREQIRIQKDNLIDELKARLQALRQQTISQEIAFKKKIRSTKLSQMDQNISEQFENSGRKSMKTIDMYRFDVQRQIILEKQMKKKFQFDFNNHAQTILSKTQPILPNLRIPQIKKVNKSTKRNASTDKTDTSVREDSIPDSPQFGFKI